MLLERIRSPQCQVGIIGLGYVGLPLAMTCVRRGFQVLGFDVDSAKVKNLMAGQSYIAHLSSERVGEMVKSGDFEATTNFHRLSDPDVLLICVPTPLTWQRKPDMRFVESTARQIAKTLRGGQLVVLESTTYPGTTDQLVREILEKESSGAEGERLKCGEGFFLAFSPEREDPANPDFETATIPKVVGGVDEASTDLAVAFYDQIIQKTVRLSSARAAEATKLTENIFRAVNIALVNELKVIYDKMAIDVWEVLDAASSKPFGFMRFNPGPGWGGHCIPIDPFYLTWKAREYGVQTRFIELAGEVNVEMPEYVIRKLMLALNEQGKPLKGARVLVLGVAYKKDVDDARESPAFVILDKLQELGAELAYHDPHVPTLPRTRRWPHLPMLESLPLTVETVRAQDAVLVITDHRAVDYALVEQEAALVVDTRGIYRALGSKVIRA